MELPKLHVEAECVMTRPLTPPGQAAREVWLTSRGLTVEQRWNAIAAAAIEASRESKPGEITERMCAKCGTNKIRYAVPNTHGYAVAQYRYTCACPNSRESGEPVSGLVHAATAAALNSANMCPFADPPNNRCSIKTCDHCSRSTPEYRTEREHCDRVAASRWKDLDEWLQLADLLLSERAAAFQAGDKSGYERGRAEGAANIGGYNRLLADFAELQSKNKRIVKEWNIMNDASLLLESKYQTLEAAARAAQRILACEGDHCPGLDAALTPTSEPKP
jgi:hypothetical protein